MNIKSAFEIFKVVGQVLTDLETLYRIVREIIEDYAKQNCVYLELRSTPKALLSQRGGPKGTIKDYIDTVIKAIKDGEEAENGKIRVRYISSINRSAPAECAVEAVNLAIKYKEEGEQYLVGVELSGDPRTGRFSDFKEALTLAKTAGLKVSLHCAELPEQNVETPEMLDFQPDRLGHCIYMV